VQFVAVEIEPPELAQLVDFAERPRVDDWSLRSALVRYAQPQPQRVQALLESVRRLDFTLGKHRKTIEKTGPELWATLQSGADDGELVALLRVATEIDELGDVLAKWALDPDQAQPNDAVDRVVAGTSARLDALGVAREEGPPPGRRGRG
jgi:hypothetical protein